MDLLKKNTNYAIKALVTLGSQENQYVSARSISETQKIPYSFLRKILQALIKNGIVESKEGGSGGFRLKLPPEQVGIIKLIEIFQGDINLAECMFRNKMCFNRPHCVLRENILEIQDLAIRKFSKLTIGKLINKRSKKRRKK
jgi:Rrf2 family protein